MFDVMQFLSQVSPFHFGINFLDIIIVLVIVFYAYEGYSLGFVLAFFDLTSFILSFIIALKLYPVLSKALITLFSLPLGFSNAASFIFIAFLSEVILGILFRRLLTLLPDVRKPQLVAKILQKLNSWLGFIPGSISAFIVLSFLLSVIVSLPSSPLIKNLVTDSKIGSGLIANTSLFEKHLNAIFGGALDETLNFLTVKPQSDESISLHFKTTEGTVDEQAEQEMLILVNQERASAGVQPVTISLELRDVARAHSQDMLTRGYFSHYTPERDSPFDRMETAGIAFTYAGENLALAPSTFLAMQGLMNSTGHRANILNPNFNKIGIGVIDGGIYGKMYSQEFTD